MKDRIFKSILIFSFVAVLLVVLFVLFEQPQGPRIAKAAAPEASASPHRNWQDYLPLPGVEIPDTPKIQLVGVVLYLWKNPIYKEILKSPDVLNVIIDHIDARDKNFGFFLCNEDILGTTFIPFKEYLEIGFEDDNNSARIITTAEEMSRVLRPWGIPFGESGTLQISEWEFVRLVFLDFLDGKIGACWGGLWGEELVIYGTGLEEFFSSLFQHYATG